MNTLELTIAQEAGAWLFRLKDDRSAECRAEFDAWLQKSPQHVTEFLLITATDVELGSLEGAAADDLQSLLGDLAPNVVPLPEKVRTASAPHHQSKPAVRRSRRVLAIAASLAGAALVSTALWQSGVIGAQDYRTGTGEQRTLKLADGSVVQLNTRSHIEVSFSKRTRTIRLIDGEALFTVAPETGRSFVVRTAGAAVQAIGTQFNIHSRDGAGQATVTVLEGRVKITGAAATATNRSAHAPLLLDAGQQAAIEPTGRIVKSSAPQLSRATAWQQRRLEFRSATVAEVAAEFNRYNRLQIQIADQTIATRRMTGLFEADEPQSLLDFLTNEGGVWFETRDDTVVLHAGENTR